MSQYKEITTDELLKMLAAGPLLLVDVRNDDEVARGIIPGAMHVPLAMLPMQYAALAKAEKLVFYCHSGVRSAHAADFASGQGRQDVYNLIGGVLAWAKAGHSFAAKNEGKTNNGI
jgi:rhodanese-related sulfurtransferase